MEETVAEVSLLGLVPKTCLFVCINFYLYRGKEILNIKTAFVLKKARNHFIKSDESLGILKSVLN